MLKMLTDTRVTEEQIQVNTNSYLEGSNDLPLSLDIVQDFFWELDMKPHIYLLEISIISLYYVIVRPTKLWTTSGTIAKFWHSKTFLVLKISGIFLISFSMKLDTFLYNKVLSLKVKLPKHFNYKSWSPCLIFFTEKKSERFHWFLILKNEFECTNFAIFEKVAHDFGRSDDDMI